MSTVNARAAQTHGALTTHGASAPCVRTVTALPRAPTIPNMVAEQDMGFGKTSDFFRNQFNDVFVK